MAAAPLPAGTVVAADARLCDAVGDCVGEVLAFAQNGYPAWLEVCSWSDDGTPTPADALRMPRRP